MGRVDGIFVAVAAGARCVPVAEARAVAGVGLEGDRYALGTGTFSAGPGKGRQLTLVSVEALERVRAGGIDLAPGAARRNVECSEVDLDALVGQRFRIGSVECVGVRDCPPCAHLERLTTTGVRPALEGAGGLRADILTSGMIAVGDEVVPC